MEEMYSLSIDIHWWGVLGLLAVIGWNLFWLLRSGNIIRYARRMRIAMPVSASLIALLIFTGAVMMAAKHLSFTTENVVMIVFSIALIVMEAKRYKLLKRSNIEKHSALQNYKTKGFKILGTELLLTLLITGWMLL
jgi:phosphoglycerol transferase MdoB-like AlkP superfamily enzyme